MNLADAVPGAQVAAHLLNLGRLCGDNRLGQGLDLRVLRLLQGRVGHADGVLVMGNHHLHEHLVQIGVRIHLAHHPTHRATHHARPHHAAHHAVEQGRAEGEGGQE